MQLSRSLQSWLRPLLILLVLVEGTACARRRTVQPQAEPSGAPPAAEPSGGRPATPDGESRDDADLAIDSGAEGDPRWSVVDARIYFAFDRSDLSADARAVLAAKLAVLLVNPDIHIRITGHADERGSDEYNLALGMERAAAARRFLTQRGVDADRVAVASMGEEQPICTASAEACWWQNRRDEFVITSIARASRP